MMTSPLANIGILSIGEMGLGVAKLLTAQNYHVLTNINGRSQSTHKRAESASITTITSDADLVAQSDYILSIVPPRDALATAQRITSASFAHPRPSDRPLLYYLDLNAISPRSARSIADAFAASTPHVRFLDGGIIGGPPSPPPSSPPPDEAQVPASAWHRPSIVLSGPHALSAAPISGPHLAATLNARHVSADTGVASGLKCCFAALTKGFTALAVQSFSTAARLGVLPELQAHLAAHSPQTGELAARGLVGMPPKAGRWVEEMRQIGQAVAEEGGWGEGASVLGEVAEVYKVVAEETELGRGWRGGGVEDVVAAVGRGLEGSRKGKREM